MAAGRVVGIQRGGDDLAAGEQDEDRGQKEQGGERGEEQAAHDGFLHWPATQMPPPIGYICAVKDPDGNVVEFSYDQGVYAKAQEVWGPQG